MSLVSSLNVGVSSLRAYASGIQTVSNNIANVNTVGYKASHAQYSDTFSNMLRPMVPNEKGDAAKIAPTQVGGGVQVQAVSPVFSQGTLQVTSSSSDLAIAGNGFFLVRNPQTQQFFVTRAGNFRVDASGALVTQQGYRVQGSLNASTRVVYDSTTGSYNVLGTRDNYSVVVNAGTDSDLVTGVTSLAAGSKVLTVPLNQLSRLSTGMPVGGGTATNDSKFRQGTVITEINPATREVTLSDGVLEQITALDSFSIGKKSIDSQSFSVTFPCDYLRPDLIKGMPLIGTGVKPGTVIADPGVTGNLKVTVPAAPGLLVVNAANNTGVTFTPETDIKVGATLTVATTSGISPGMVISNPGGPYDGLVVSSVDAATNSINVVKLDGDGKFVATGLAAAVSPPNPAVLSFSLSGAKTLDKKKNYILIPTNSAIREGDPVTGDGIRAGTKVGALPVTNPPNNIADHFVPSGYQKVFLVDSSPDKNPVFPTMDSFAAVRLAFKDQIVTISDYPMTDSFKNVTLSLGNAYRPAASVGDVRISFNEYDQMEADPTRVPDYTFVGTDGKPLDGITLQAARAGAPKIRTFNVGATGDINIVLSNGQTFTSGAVLLQMFKDPGALTREGDNLFSGMNTAGPYNGPFIASNISALTPSTGGLGVINGGSLELSNVDLGEEFSSMIITQRAFQAGSRLISTADQMLEEAVNLKR